MLGNFVNELVVSYCPKLHSCVDCEGSTTHQRYPQLVVILLFRCLSLPAHQVQETPAEPLGSGMQRVRQIVETLWIDLSSSCKSNIIALLSFFN